MKGFILRRKGLGATSTPIIAEVAGLTVVNSAEGLPPADADIVVRWGTITGLNGNPKQINTAQAIETSSDKKQFRTKLQKEGLCPKTWFDFDEFIKDIYPSFAPKVQEGANGSVDTHKPVERVLIRPAIHSRSESMFLCTSLYEAKKAIQGISGGYYISEFIQKKREFRVMVVQGRVSWVIEKHPKSEEDVSWGCVEEGKFDYVDWSDWPMDVIRNAIRAVELAGLDFGAADVIVDGTGKAYTLEVNTAPWLSPYYAKQIGLALKYMIAGGKTEKIDPSEMTDWKKAIHPCRL